MEGECGRDGPLTCSAGAVSPAGSDTSRENDNQSFSNTLGFASLPKVGASNISLSLWERWHRRRRRGLVGAGAFDSPKRVLYKTRLCFTDDKTDRRDAGPYRQSLSLAYAQQLPLHKGAFRAGRRGAVPYRPSHLLRRSSPKGRALFNSAFCIPHLHLLDVLTLSFCLCIIIVNQPR